MDDEAIRTGEIAEPRGRMEAGVCIDALGACAAVVVEIHHGNARSDGTLLKGAVQHVGSKYVEVFDSLSVTDKRKPRPGKPGLNGQKAPRAPHDDHLCGRTMSFFCSCGALMRNCANRGFERGLFVSRIDHANEARRRVGFVKFNVPIMRP